MLTADPGRLPSAASHPELASRPASVGEPRQPIVPLFFRADQSLHVIGSEQEHEPVRVIAQLADILGSRRMAVALAILIDYYKVIVIPDIHRMLISVTAHSSGAQCAL
jgi:hypothetical protein